jgi:hypothetical protein
VIDIEALLVAWLEDTIEDVRASTETPPDLGGQLPWLQVVRIGGPYDGYRIDRPTVDIAAFDATGPEASALAAQVQVLMHEQFARGQVGSAVISRVETVTGPHWVPYDNPAMRRYEATYRLAVHPA